MEEGTKAKKTIFVAGLAEQVDEAAIYQTFQTFGDILEVQLPPAPETHRDAPFKHRGFAFVTFSSPADAQDAIDNMDMNELEGKVLKVNIARPNKTMATPSGSRAIWENEDWLKAHVKPLAESGGVQGRSRSEEAEEDGDGDAAMDES